MQLYIYKKIHPYNDTVKMSKFIETMYLYKNPVWVKSYGNYITLWKGGHECTATSSLVIPGIEVYSRREFSAIAEFLVEEYEPYVNIRSSEIRVEEIKFQTLPYFCYCEAACIKVYFEGSELKVEFTSGEYDMKGFTQRTTPTKLTLTEVRRYL